MTCIPAKGDNPHGLHRVYNVTKADGGPVDPMATYLVLRLDNFSRDGLHVLASRAAAKAYAECILDHGERQGTHLDRVAIDLKRLLENLDRDD